MAKTYAVIGKGDVPEKALKAALNDLPEDAKFVCYKEGKGSESQNVLWNWLIDNERTFSIYGTQLGKSFAEYAEEVEMDTHLGVVKRAKELLVLWDDSNTVEEACMEADSLGMKILDLTNGLATIEVVPDTQEPEKDLSRDELEDIAAEAEIQEPVPDSDESTELTRKDLEGMPVAAVKRQAVDRGIDIKGRNKAELIDLICRYGCEPVEDDEVEIDTPYVAPNNVEEAKVELAQADPVMMTLLLSDGSVVTFTGRPLLEKILALL